MKTIYTLIILFFGSCLFAQKELLKPCGTPTFKTEWLKKYQKDPDSYQKRSGVVLWVPISVTIVGNDDGTAMISERTVHESLCTLNDDFAESEIQFYLAKPVRYIFNTAYANHQTVLEGAQMMFDNNYPNMINNYIMTTAAGNCGYNLPYAGIALSNMCTSADDHTWAHEIGHNLSLPHPFLGWEGGVSHNGSIPHDFNDPAPETVTYDYTYFQDTLILDTLIIDTAFVEKMDGSNCSFAADGFCDTKPDYLASRWACDADGNSLVEQTDPNGVKFYSDGSLYMSYASDNCSNHFSPEQIEAMRANLIDEKPTYLGNENVLEPTSNEEVAVLEPEFLEEVYFQDVNIDWEPVENATAYTIQIALTPSYGLVVFDSLVYDDFMVIPEMQFSTRKHYFRIKALNEYNFCSEYIAFGAFETTESQTSIGDVLLKEIKLTHNIVQQGIPLEIMNSDQTRTKVSISNISGQIMYQQELIAKHTELNTSGWTPGIYFLTLELGESRTTEKVVITH